VPTDFIFAQLVKSGNPNPQKYKMAVTCLVLGMMNLLPYQKTVFWKDAIDAQFLLYVWILYMFQATLCSSSGGQLIWELQPPGTLRVCPGL